MQGDISSFSKVVLLLNRNFERNEKLGTKIVHDDDLPPITTTLKK